ncbi:MAG: phosphate/phosphite/phosphonate ABC transporter substrate-binding protein [Nitrospiraceae bacterium]|nr:phosphate/phosphite/phosphonate ABC transporter substrate-binding protein [Nitrospiraceae bacterium]
MIDRWIRFVTSSFILLALALPGKASAQQQEPLKLCVHPYLAASELVKRFTPLGEYLSRKIGKSVAVEVGNTYETHIHRIGNGIVDIAFMGPASYVQLTERYGKRPILAAFQTKEGKFFHGRIMARKDSSITSLSQLKGKRFVFGDPNSTMSHVVPRYLLLKSGIRLKDLAEVKFLANHDNIAMGILAGTFDAGAVKEEVFLQYESRGLRSLATTPPIPDHLFVVRAGFPADTTRALQDAMLHLADTAEGRSILTGIRNDVTALVPAEDAEYDSLRTIMRELKRAGVEF